MTTYISKIAKNGRHQYFRVTDDGKKKVIGREEYEANVVATQAVEPEIETAATLAEIEVNDRQSDLPNDSAEYAAEPIPPRAGEQSATETETAAPFDFVKSSVGEIIGKYKLTFKEWKKYASVYYRSAAIIGFVFDESHNITAVRFMGTTLETRKAVTEHKIENPSDLSGIMGFIRRQIEFVNWWWDNPQATSGGAA
jgi:hypothetical protein